MKYQPASTQLRQDALNDAKNARLRQQCLHANRAYLNKVMRTLRAINADGARVYAYGGALPDVVFKLDIPMLDGFKDKRLIKALERVERAAGCQFDRTWDSSWSATPAREFRATFRYQGRMSVDICVNAMVKADAPTCRRVQVGERVHVEPVFEIQCD